jgi:hypothetical protein
MSLFGPPAPPTPPRLTDGNFYLANLIANNPNQPTFNSTGGFLGFSNIPKPSEDYVWQQPKPGFWDYLTGEHNNPMFREGRWVKK